MKVALNPAKGSPYMKDMETNCGFFYYILNLKKKQVLLYFQKLPTNFSKNYSAYLCNLQLATCYNVMPIFSKQYKILKIFFYPFAFRKAKI